MAPRFAAGGMFQDALRAVTEGGVNPLKVMVDPVGEVNKLKKHWQENPENVDSYGLPARMFENYTRPDDRKRAVELGSGEARTIYGDIEKATKMLRDDPGAFTPQQRERHERTGEIPFMASGYEQYGIGRGWAAPCKDEDRCYTVMDRMDFDYDPDDIRSDADQRRFEHIKRVREGIPQGPAADPYSAARRAVEAGGAGTPFVSEWKIQADGSSEARLIRDGDYYDREFGGKQPEPWPSDYHRQGKAPPPGVPLAPAHNTFGQLSQPGPFGIWQPPRLR